MTKIPKENRAVAVDLGATNLRACIGNSHGELLKKTSRATVVDGASGEAVTRQVISMIQSLVDDGSSSGLAGIGIGSIGPLLLQEGVVDHSPNVPYDRIPLKKPIREQFNVPVFLLNDCAAAVVGEKFFGAGKGKENLAYVTLSSGIGAGIYVDDHLLQGRKGNATEVGHVIVDPQGKLTCGCGKRGHWEAYCGGANIQRYVKLLLREGKISESRLSQDGSRPTDITPKKLYELARQGNKAALRIVRKIASLNTIGFANIINCFAPSLLTVGGAIALNNPKLVLNPIRERVENYTINDVPPIKVTPLGEEAVLYGALGLVFYES